MKKLTYLETLEAERQEKIKAKKQALLQEDQRQKRLWYIPMLLEIFVLIVTLIAMYTIVYGVGYVTGDANVVCPSISCPVVQSVCELQKTGAN